MKKSFTLIELIFVIVIIGLLAVVAIPRFKNLTLHAKNASIKSVINSVQDSIENIHSKWLVNEDFIWDVNGDGKSDLNSNGYPKKLDEGKDTSKLFSYVLKVPVIACSNNQLNCWYEYEDKKYEYRFNKNKKLRIEYNSTVGLMQCIDGVNYSKEKCEKTIFQ